MGLLPSVFVDFSRYLDVSIYVGGVDCVGKVGMAGLLMKVMGGVSAVRPSSCHTLLLHHNIIVINSHLTFNSISF